MIKLVCPECQRQNEPERIYCHDCGARLDRSALAKVAPKIEDPKQTQKRLKQMLDPGRIKLRLLFFKVSKLVLGACSAAILIQMLQPPRELPEKVKNSDLQQINLDLENAINSHSKVPLQFTETQVNNYLVNVVKSKHVALSKYVEFERAMVNFEEGVCRVTIERSLFGFSVFHSISFRITALDGTINTVMSGGSIGRMPIHPAIIKYGDILFADLLTAVEREKKLVVKLTPIQFHPKLVVLNAPTIIAPPTTEVAPVPAPSEAQPEATPTPSP